MPRRSMDTLADLASGIGHLFGLPRPVVRGPTSPVVVIAPADPGARRSSPGDRKRRRGEDSPPPPHYRGVPKDRDDDDIDGAGATARARQRERCRIEAIISSEAGSK